MVRNHRFSRLATLTSLAVLVAIGVSVRCGTATATLIAYDPFNQTAGAISGTASTSPGVWPTAQTWGGVGGTVNITSGSLSVPSGVVGLSTDGNRAVLVNNATNQVAAFRDFGTTYNTASDTDLWFSFLYRPTVTSGINEGISLFNGTQEMLFFGSDGNGDLVIRAVQGQSTTASDANNQFANTLVDATSNQTFQIVARIRGTTEYKIWVDPTGFDHLLGVPTGSKTASLLTGTGLQTFSFNRIRLGDATTSSTAGSADFDEFRMATTAVEVVPEPSTWAMALGGVAAFFWRQSRRSRRSR
jgi:hypothetical protein